MEFKTLFAILKNRISDGLDVPQFFRDVMAMITDVSEEEWGTPKDPSNKLTKEETLRTYAKRGPSKKFALSVVYRLTPENCIESINERSTTVRQLLADDLSTYNGALNADNVAEAIAEWLVEIFRTIAGLVPLDDIEKEKQQRLTKELKTKYGEYLLSESGGHCPFPGCGKLLTFRNQGKIQHAYEVAVIDKKKSPDVDNLIAACPQCQATYQIDNSRKLCKELKTIKVLLEAHHKSEALLDTMPLEKGISGVIGKIQKLKEKDLEQASLDPKEIKQKIDPDVSFVLYKTVNNYVTTYFLKIKEIMMGMDKRNEIDYESVQDQMHAIYKKLKKANKSNEEIFNEITEKIHKVSLRDNIYCQIVVSYFIQSCEVFDAITK